MCTKEIKETAYPTLVRPCLEYVSSIWDTTYQLYLIYDGHFQISIDTVA